MNQYRFFSEIEPVQVQEFYRSPTRALASLTRSAFGSDNAVFRALLDQELFKSGL